MNPIASPEVQAYLDMASDYEQRMITAAKKAATFRVWAPAKVSYWEKQALAWKRQAEIARKRARAVYVELQARKETVA